MESIHKIPINEAFSEKCGCPLCRLYKRYEANLISFLFEEGIMNPETRIETNKYGFCSRHADMLLDGKQSLSVALLFETRLRALHVPLMAGTNPKSVIKEIEKAIDNCYVCNSLDKTMPEVAEYVSVMYKDEEFKKLFCEQEYFCLPHTKLLIETCKLSGAKKKEYIDELLSINCDFTSKTRQSMLRYAERFDYKASKDSIEKDKNATRKAVKYMTGE